MVTRAPCARAAITPSMSPLKEELKSLTSKELANVPSIVTIFGDRVFFKYCQNCVSLTGAVESTRHGHRALHAGRSNNAPNTGSFELIREKDQSYQRNRSANRLGSSTSKLSICSAAVLK